MPARSLYRAVSSHPESGTRRGDTRRLDATDVLVRSGLYRKVEASKTKTAKAKTAAPSKTKTKRTAKTATARPSKTEGGDG